MTINTVSVNRIPTNTSVYSSMESDKLQTQLTSKQQRLNRLSSDNDMTAQDKEKERREIQREIEEINRKLKLEQIEEKQEAKETSKEQERKKIISEELLEKEDSKKLEKEKADEEKEEDKRASSAAEKEDSLTKDIPLVTIKNVLNASSEVEQNKVQENVGKELDNQKDILRAEMQSDNLLGTDTTSKKEAIDKLQKKEKLQIEVLNKQPEIISPDMNLGSKIIIRE